MLEIWRELLRRFQLAYVKSMAQSTPSSNNQEVSIENGTFKKPEASYGEKQCDESNNFVDEARWAIGKMAAQFRDKLRKIEGDISDLLFEHSPTETYNAACILRFRQSKVEDLSYSIGDKSIKFTLSYRPAEKRAFRSQKCETIEVTLKLDERSVSFYEVPLNLFELGSRPGASQHNSRYFGARYREGELFGGLYGYLSRIASESLKLYQGLTSGKSVDEHQASLVDALVKSTATLLEIPRFVEFVTDQQKARAYHSEIQERLRAAALRISSFVDEIPEEVGILLPKILQSHSGSPALPSQDTENFGPMSCDFQLSPAGSVGIEDSLDEDDDELDDLLNFKLPASPE